MPARFLQRGKVAHTCSRRNNIFLKNIIEIIIFFYAVTKTFEYRICTVKSREYVLFL